METEKVIQDQRVYLKIKLKELAAEARYNRAEASRLRAREKWAREHEEPYANWSEGVYRHRVDVIRPEARATALAYGFIRGRQYREMEPTAESSPSWGRVREMVSKYGLAPFDSTYKRIWPSREDWKAAKAEEASRLEEWIKTAQS